jgi:hypothetical protein
LTTARRVKTGLYRFVRLGWATFAGLKIRCPKGRAGSPFTSIGQGISLSDFKVPLHHPGKQQFELAIRTD